MWVSDGSSSGGVENDQGFVDLLEQQDFLVSRVNFLGDGNALTESERNLFNFADLGVVSRDTLSGNYNDAAGMNGLTVPLINLNPYLARTSRWNWVPFSDMYFTAAALLPEIPDDAIFHGVTRNVIGGVPFVTTTIEILGILGIANGDFLGSPLFFEPRLRIQRWLASTPFHFESTASAAGPRMLLPIGQIGTKGSATIGRYNLTADGARIFVNSVDNLKR